MVVVKVVQLELMGGKLAVWRVVWLAVLTVDRMAAKLLEIVRE